MRRLLVFNDQLLFFDGRRYSSRDPFVNFIAGAQKYFERITLLSRLVRGNGVQYEPLPGCFDVMELPFYNNIPELCMRFVSHYQALSQAAEKVREGHDFFWLNFAHPVSIVILRKIRGERGIFSLVRGNYILDAYYKNLSVLKIPAVLSALFAERYYARLSKKNCVPLFAVGRKLSEKYSGMGLDVTTIYPTLVTLEEARTFSSLKRNYDLSSRRVVKLLYIGRLSREKGVLNLVEVLCAVAAKRENLFLTIVGEGKEKELLLKRARELGVEKKLRVVDTPIPRSEIYNFFMDNDIFLLPSLTEGFPQVILEALLFGMPVVSTDAGSVMDILEDGKNSFIVKRGDIKTMAERILTLIDEPGLAERLGSHSREKVSGITLESEIKKIFRKILNI